MHGKIAAKDKYKVQNTKGMHQRRPIMGESLSSPFSELQQSIGNKALTGLLQAKFKSGQPGDVNEKEADKAADVIVSSTETTNMSSMESKKQTLDAELEQDFNLIVAKLDESHYSDADEGEVIGILRKWAEEKFTTRPKLYPKGGQFLDKLFSKLVIKTKDIGIVADQITNYYSLIFEHFDRVDEVKQLRDRYSIEFKGDDGIKSQGFWGYFWEEVKNGSVEDEIYAYFGGMIDAGIGMVEGLAFLLTNPEKVLKSLVQLPGAVAIMIKNRDRIWNDFVSAPKTEQARIIGRIVGELELIIYTAGAGGSAAPILEVQPAVEVVAVTSRGAGVLSGGGAISINMGQLGIESARLTAMMAKTSEASVEGKNKGDDLSKKKGEEVFDELNDEMKLDSKKGSNKSGLTPEQEKLLIQEAKNAEMEGISGSYVEKFKSLYKDFPGGQEWQVHHSIPQKFRQIIKDAGIDVDNPVFLRGVRTTAGEFKNVHAKLTNHWQDWHRAFKAKFNRDPSAAEIIEHAKQVDWQFRHLFWEVEKMAGIPVPKI